MLDDMLMPKSDVPSRWVKQIPIKVNVLAWKISMDRLPTRVNLHRRGVQLQSSSKQVLEGVFYISWWSIWSYRNHLLFSDSNHRKDGIFEDIVMRSFSCCRSKKSLKSFYSIAKSPYPSFKVDERMIWVEISGTPPCAWGLNALKKVASFFGKFVFFEAEDSIAISAGRICIATKSQKHIYEKVLVEVHGEHFKVDVQEISTWSVNIFDNSRDMSSNLDVNEVVNDVDVANSVEDNSIDDLNENLNNMDHDFKDDKEHMENSENAFSVQPDTQMKDDIFVQHEIQKEEEVCKVHKPDFVDDTFDVSKPPGFKHFKRSPSHSSKCSTSFARHHARHHKKDIKGVSLIHELNKFIELGNALGYDVIGCRKSLNRMINGLIDLPIGGCYYPWMNKVGTKLSKLDRFLILDDILEAIPDIRITAIDRLLVHLRLNYTIDGYCVTV
nr:hypothetical protein [Tanacetum cinerariifolium]